MVGRSSRATRTASCWAVSAMLINPLKDSLKNKITHSYTFYELITRTTTSHKHHETSKLV